MRIHKELFLGLLVFMALCCLLFGLAFADTPATNTLHDKPEKTAPTSSDETYVWDVTTGTLKKAKFSSLPISSVVDSSKQNVLGFTPEDIAHKGVASGYAPLGVDAKVDDSIIPDGITRDSELSTGLGGKQDSLGFTPEDIAHKDAALGYLGLDEDGLIPDAKVPTSIARSSDLETGLGTKQDSLGFTPEDSANKGAASGYAGLGEDSKVSDGALPAGITRDAEWDADSNGYVDRAHGGLNIDATTNASILTGIGAEPVLPTPGADGYCLKSTTGNVRSFGACYTPPTMVEAIEFVIDGGGAAITTGVKGYLEIPYALTITNVTLVCDQSGSIVVDVWKDTYANYPPTVADTITASSKPTLSSAIKQQPPLTGWTTSVSSDDWIGVKVDSATTVTRCTLSIKGTR